MGITLGRNPDGVVSDLRQRLAVLEGRLPVLAAITVVEAALTAAWLAGALSGWWAFVIGFLVPFIAARLVEERPARVEDPLDGLETLGVDRPVTDADLAALDRALALAEVAPT
jgi:hypothetical protein